MAKEYSDFIDLTIDTAETYSDSETVSVEQDESTIDENEFEYPPYTHSIRITPSEPLFQKGPRRRRKSQEKKKISKKDIQPLKVNQQKKLPELFQEMKEKEKELKGFVQTDVVEKKPRSKPLIKQPIELPEDIFFSLDKELEKQEKEEKEKERLEMEKAKRNSEKTLGQNDILCVCKYLDLIEMVRLVHTNKRYREIFDALQYNPFPITTKKEREYLKNLNEWCIYYANRGEVEKDFKAIYIRGKPIRKIRMVEPLTVNEGKKFIENHPEITYYEQYVERLVMDPTTDTKTNKTRKNKLLDPNTVVLDTPIRINKDLKELDIKDTKIIKLPAFTLYEHTQVSKISLPSTLEELGYKCFWRCYSLKEIDIPLSVTSINTGCFEYCTNLTKIQLPSYLEYLGTDCFSHCAFTQITIPTTLRYLDQSVFEYCSHLKDIQFSQKLETIKTGCFYNCVSLREIILPQSLTSLEDEVFYSCQRLTSVVLPKGLISLGTGTFQNCPLTNVILPTTLTEIGERCFASSLLLSKISLPENDFLLLGTNWDKGRYLHPKK